MQGIWEIEKPENKKGICKSKFCSLQNTGELDSKAKVQHFSSTERENRSFAPMKFPKAEQNWHF